ncbi:MAG: cytochrome b/b6 domain-containing protein [Pseudomonadota bacterium]
MTRSGSTLIDRVATAPRSPLLSDPSVRVWDLPLRLCHWSFAFLVPGLWWTAENSQWGLHKRFGVALFGLLVFRIIWGFIGTKTARFGSFVKDPLAVLAYLTGKAGSAAQTIGHNPIGALSVLALLGFMLVQVGTGLFAGDPYDGATGPLNALVGVATADALTQWHEWFYWVVIVMVALHLSAIVFYAAAKHNDLVSPMISGRKIFNDAVDENEPAPLGRFLLAAGMSAGLAVWVAFGAPPLG